MEQAFSARPPECSALTPASSFRFESDLCSVLVGAIEQADVLAAAQPTVFEELHVGTVVPDVVLVSMSSRGLPTEFSSFESWVVASFLRCRRLTLEALAARLYARRERTERALTSLLNRRIVRRASGTAYELCREWLPANAEVIAIEAKLTRWREAVDQASAYLRFADRAYVALPRETTKRAHDLLSACRARGLGLLGVGPDGVELMRRAPRRRTRSPEWVWVLGRALALPPVTASCRAPARSATPSDGRAPFED